MTMESSKIDEENTNNSKNDVSFDMDLETFPFEEELQYTTRYYRSFCESLTKQNISNSELKDVDQAQRIKSPINLLKQGKTNLKEWQYYEKNATKNEVKKLQGRVKELEETVKKMGEEYETKFKKSQQLRKNLQRVLKLYVERLDYKIKVEDCENQNVFKAIVHFNKPEADSESGENQIEFYINSDTRKVIDLNFGSGLKNMEEEFRRRLRENGYSQSMLAEIRNIVLQKDH